MEDKYEIMELLQKKQSLEEELNSLVYGSVEVRKEEKNSYIYVHYRDNGILLTKYVGEYSTDLYNLILNNNIKSKDIKKQIRDTEKRLKTLNYTDSNLSENVELNIDFAKKHMTDSIYDQAILEGVATTYSDTESIIEGGKVNNMTSEDIMKIVNLKHAWDFILNENVIQSPTNFVLLCEINKTVEEGFYYNAGKVRSTPVKIGGTKWAPELPVESVIKEELDDLFNKKMSYIDKAVEIVLYVMKKQIFLDGNKRTAIIFANHFLIANGKGLMVVPADCTQDFKTMLIDYYEKRNVTKIKKFLKEKCYLKLD